MDYSIFLTQFKAAKDKESVMKKHIKTEYISFATKMAECKEIVKRSNTKVVDGEEIFAVDSISRYFGFVMRLFALYTDITWDDTIIVEAFDALNKNGAVDMLSSCIPEREYTEFSTILQMAQDDYMMNNRDIVPFLETKINALSETIGVILDSFSSAAISNGDEGVVQIQESKS